MKKHFFRVAGVRRVVNRFVFTLFIAAAGFAAHAQTEQVKQDINTPTASIKYIGSQGGMLSVAVKYDNEPRNKFTVTVKDQEGYMLYQGSFNDRKFNRIFQFPKTAVSKVSFTISNTKTNETQSFEVDARLVEDGVVKRIG